jgi:amino acid permease
MRNKISTILLFWIIILLFELLWFRNLAHQVHDLDEVLFIMTVIMITLIVGAVLIVIITIGSRGHNSNT